MTVVLYQKWKISNQSGAYLSQQIYFIPEVTNKNTLKFKYQVLHQNVQFLFPLLHCSGHDMTMLFYMNNVHSCKTMAYRGPYSREISVHRFCCSHFVSQKIKPIAIVAVITRSLYKLKYGR